MRASFPLSLPVKRVETRLGRAFKTVLQPPRMRGRIPTLHTLQPRLFPIFKSSAYDNSTFLPICRLPYPFHTSRFQIDVVVYFTHNLFPPTFNTCLIPNVKQARKSCDLSCIVVYLAQYWHPSRARFLAMFFCDRNREKGNVVGLSVLIG
ncbi:hypothetical protein BD289DRAFT_181601 [Coniella lustricola]|uniref:Uncharacterized protein n=1 Tax=Coniella lustricola TaxID=2025994 RepID=A0A2T3ADK8_9PEZI|nr:hypothetical protein BD289DRAFT_181601 [Coniella lustricola]